MSGKHLTGKHLTGMVIYGCLWDEKREHWIVDIDLAKFFDTISPCGRNMRKTKEPTVSFPSIWNPVEKDIKTMPMQGFMTAYWNGVRRFFSGKNFWEEEVGATKAAANQQGSHERKNQAYAEERDTADVKKR